MKKKRLLAMVMSFIMLIGMMSAAFPASALVSGIGNVTGEDVTKTEELTVVTPVSEYDTVTDTTVLYESASKSELPFTTEFDYTASEDGSVSVTFDQNQGTNVYTETYSNDYDGEDAVAPEGDQTATLIDDANGGKMVNLCDTTSMTATFCDLNGNYILDFWIQANNSNWDWIDIYLRDDISLSFRGAGNAGGAYTAYIMQNPTTNTILATAAGISNLTDGCYIRVIYNNGNIEVYQNSVNDFSGISPILSAAVSGLSSEGTLKIYKYDALCYIDDISIYNLDEYTVEYPDGKAYNEVAVNGTTLSVNTVIGESVTEHASYTLSGDSHIAATREGKNVKVYVDEVLAIDTEVTTDHADNPVLSVDMTATEGAVSNVKVYNTANIIFTDGYPVAVKDTLSDSISLVSTSYADGSSVTQNGNNVTVVASTKGSNTTVDTSNWFADYVGDFDLTFNILKNRSNWTYDYFNFRDADGKGFNVYFGVGQDIAASYYFDVKAAGMTVTPIYEIEQGTFYNFSGYSYVYEVRIVRKDTNLKVYCKLARSGIKTVDVLFGEYTLDSTTEVNMYYHLQQGTATITDIVLYDTADISKVTAEIKDAEYTEDYTALSERIAAYLETVSSNTRFSVSAIAQMKSVYETMKDLSGTKENYQTLLSYWNTFLNSGNANSRVLLISDTHTADITNVLELGEEVDVDGIMHMGDLANRGTLAEYGQITQVLNKYSRYGHDNFFVSPGNHDTGGDGKSGSVVYSSNASAETYETAAEGTAAWIKGLADYMPEGLTVPYYSGKIGNMNIIVLSRERRAWMDIGVSDDQITFLKAELEKAGKDNPILILLHETFWNQNGYTGTTSYPKILEAIEGYDNVIFFTGHKHTALSAGEQVYTDSGYINVNMPSMGYQGTGYVLEEYVDNLVLRAVDFTTGTWLTEYDLVLPTTTKAYDTDVAIPVAELESAPEDGTPVYEKDLSNFSLSFEYYSDSDATWYFDSVDGDKNNCYQLTLSGGTIALNRIVAGVSDNLGTYEGLDTDGYYGIQVVRYMDSIRVFVNESEVLAVAAEDAAYPVTTTGSNTHWYGKLYLEDTDSAVKNIKVYDSGLITFTAGQPVLESIELADDIGLFRSSYTGKGEYCKSTEDSLTIYAGNGQNPAAYSDYWLDSDVGDFILSYNARFSQTNSVQQAIIFSAKKTENYSTDIRYFYAQTKNQFAIRNVFDYADVLNYGAPGDRTLYYRLTTVTSYGKYSDKVDPTSTGATSQNNAVKVVKKANTLTVYLNGTEIYNGTSDIPVGNMVFAIFQGTAQVTNIKISDTENKSTASVNYNAATNPAPVAEVETENVGALSIGLDAVAGYEYSINGTDYVTNPEFTGLADETEYTLYQRIAATESYNASEATAISVITALLVGDIDNDNLIDSVDISMLRKHLTDTELIADTRTADADGSEEINIKDLVRMKKYLADPYNVTLGK